MPYYYLIESTHRKREIKMQITQNHTVSDIEDQIENGTAKKVLSAGFEQGDEGEIITSFFKLWGMIVRKIHNKSDTTRKFFFVKGDDLELFEANYGRA
jgi:hypothetical protein